MKHKKTLLFLSACLLGTLTASVLVACNGADPVTGHVHNKYVISLVQPTCTAKGYDLHSCKECDYAYADNFVDALGHDYVDGVCTRCDSLFTNKGLVYDLSKDGTYYRLRSGWTCSDAEIKIPSTYKGLPVKEIGEHAFAAASTVKSISIPDSVTSIGKRAFAQCSGLTDITIPESVTQIGSDVFYNCSNLKSITVPFIGSAKDDTENTRLNYFFSTTYVPQFLKTVVIKSGTFIGEAAFAGFSGLTSITLPDSVTSIGAFAFNGCTSLTSITIPQSVTSIGWGAFYECTDLASIKIPSGVTTIGEAAFASCESLAGIEVASGNANYRSVANCLIEKPTNKLVLGCKNSVIPSSITSIGEWAFYYCKGLTSITIPQSVTSIGERAFAGCNGLTSIAIPDSVASIGEWAFAYCSKLTGITFPAGVTSIGKAALAGCSSLASIEVASGNANYKSETNCLIEKETNTLLSGCKNSVIPDGVTSIADSAFYMCQNLTSVTIPESVTFIGKWAFAHCDKLTGNVVIPNGVTAISDYAFYSCNITSVTIGTGVTFIAANAFGNNDGLTSVTFATADGWSCNGNAISSSALSNPETAARYLTKTYYWTTWSRE